MITRIVKYEARSNGQIAVTLRVNADPASDYVLTLDVVIAADQTQRDAKIAEAKAEAESLYQASIAAETAGINLVGTTV